MHVKSSLLTLIVWLSLAGLFAISVWNTAFDQIVFVICTSAALMANVVLYRRRGGRWKPLVIGIAALLVVMLTGALWLS